MPHSFWRRLRRHRKRRGRLIPKHRRFESLEQRLLLVSPWQNPCNPLDVNNDQIVTPNDALLPINRINAGRGGVLPDPPVDSAPPPYHDVDGDGQLVPNDVLRVINALNKSDLEGIFNFEGNLVRDTAPGGTTNDDNLTFDGRLEGVITSLLGLDTFQARVDGDEAVDVPQTCGAFMLDPGFATDGRDDGVHVVTFTGTDPRGRQAAFDVTYTLDTVPPAIDLQLAPDSDTAPQGDGATDLKQVSLIGSTDAGRPVSLFAESDPGSPLAIVNADSNGSYQFDGVELEFGDNGFRVMTSDLAGNENTATEVVTQNMVLLEEANFQVFYEQSFVVPNEPSTLSVTFSDLNFDETDDFVNDAFEASLLDREGNSLVQTIGPGRDSFFNVTESGVVDIGSNTTVDAGTVSVDLADVPAGTSGRLVLRLVNNDRDTATSVRISDISVVAGALDTPDRPSAVPQTVRQRQIDFESLSDVSESVQVEYKQTSLNQTRDLLFTELALNNEGTFGVEAPLLLAVDQISEPQVVVRNADGITPQGLPFFDFSHLLVQPTLSPREPTGSRHLEFFNPLGVQFDFDLVVLGRLNQPPHFISRPIVEAVAGRNYEYQAEAIDPEGNQPVYSLIVSPNGMTIDANTGAINWHTDTGDVGNHAVIVASDDGRGGVETQQYTLDVREFVPNRPPVITTTPIVEVFLDADHTVAEYGYTASAIDVDGDAIEYRLEQAPFAMTIDPSSGKVSWNPAADQLATHTIRITADDLRGGTATQEYQLRVLPDRTNSPPVIVTDPIEDFFVPGFSNPATGTVQPQQIRLDLSEGQVFEGTVAITLPEAVERSADIVIAVDESASMRGEQAWIGEMIPLLDQALIDAGVGATSEHPNRFAIVGGGRQNLVGYFLSQQSNTRYTLYDSGGLVVADGTINEVLPDELLNLSFKDDDRYTLVVEALDPEESGEVIEVGVRAHAGDSRRVEQLQLNTLVSDVIELPGQSVEYVFNLPKDSLLYFDSQTKDLYSHMQWSLTGPTGVLANDVRFIHSDVSVAAPVFDAPAGEYRLTVEAEFDTTTDYKFQLLDLSAAPTISSGEVIQGEFKRKVETFAYRFETSADQLFEFVNSATAHPGSQWRLLNRFGEVLNTQPLGTNEPGSLLFEAGEYYLLMEAALWPLEGTDQLRVPSHFEFVVTVSDPTPPLAVTMGETTSGVIEYVGDFVDYSFTLSDRSLVYIDSLTNSGMTWSLEGPRGNEVVDRRFDLTDSSNQLDPILDLVAGQYLLRVNSNGRQGDYSFRVLDLHAPSSITTITTGVAFDGELMPPNETGAYSFSAGAGDEYFFDFQTASGTANVNYRLIDPYGNIVLERRPLEDAEATIPTGGRYTLLIEGGITNSEPSAYTVNVVPVVNSKAELALGTTVVDSLTTPGARSEFEFELAADGLLYFDSLTNTSDLNWTLAGPRGVEVSARPFARSDSSAVAAAGMSLPAGSYQLVVEAMEDTVGEFSFRLLDLLEPGSSLPIAPPPGSGNPSVTVVGAPSSPKGTEVFRFVAEPGDEISFETTTEAGTGSHYRLLDQYGGEVISVVDLATDSLNTNLAGGGTYYLLVEGNIDSTVLDEYSIDIRWITNNSPPLINGTPLVLGDTVSGSLSTAGETDSYTFELQDRTLLYVDSLTNDGSAHWTLRGPQGELVTNRAFVSTDSFDNASPVLEVPAGTYQFDVASPRATGNYSFRVLDLAAAPPATLASPIAGTLEPANETHTYQFAASAGDSFFFDVQAASDTANTQYKLVDPYGRIVLNTSRMADQGPLVVSTDGSYTLLIEAWHSNTGLDTYIMQVNRIPEASESTLTLNTVTSGMFTVPFESIEYTFSLDDWTLLHFDSRTDTDRLSWTLAGPAGVEVNDRPFDRSDSIAQDEGVIEVPAGEYTLTITADETAEQFTFAMLDLSAAQSISAGTVVADSLPVSSGSKLYRFTAEPGDVVYFDSQHFDSGFTTAPSWRVVDQYGQQEFNLLFGQDREPVLLSGGHYTVLVEGQVDDTGVDGSFSFDVVPVYNELAPTTQLVLGETVSRAPSKAFSLERFSFSLENQSLIYFDSLTNDHTATWTVATADGREVTSPLGFNASDSSSSSRPLALPPGDFVLTVTSREGNPYAFRLLDFEDAVSVSLGTAFSGNFDIPNETDLYAFVVDDNQRIYVDASSSGPGSYRIVDEAGRSLIRQTAIVDRDVFEFVSGGTYWLAVESFVSATVSHPYDFNLIPASVIQSDLAIGQIQRATVAAPGDVLEFHLTVDRSSKLYFDSLTNSSALAWDLDGPGQFIKARRFHQSDAFGITDPTIHLVAGDYTLTVDAFADTIGDVAFRLLDLSAATPVAFSEAVSAELTIPNQTDVYEFTAAAGEELFVDVEHATDTSNLLYRILDPLGREIVSRQTDIEVGPLPGSGTFTLLVEGASNNSGQDQYRLRVHKSNTRTGGDLALGEVTSGSITTAGDRVSFDFDLGSESLVHFDSLTDDAGLRWTLTGPRGVEFEGIPFNRSDSVRTGNDLPVQPAFELKPGSYSLTVDGAGDAVGDFAFALLDLLASDHTTQVDTPTTGNPTTVTGSQSDPRQTQAYRFAAAAGDQLSFDTTTSGSVASDYRLLDPFGREVFRQPLTAQLAGVELPASGTYFLLVEGQITNSDPDDYTILVTFEGNNPPPDPTGTPLTFGEVREGSLAVDGQVDSYAFTLAESKLLYFDALTNNSTLQWSLNRSLGTLVDGMSFTATDASNNPSPVLDLPAGTYQLNVGASSGVPGAYSFVLRDLAAANPLALGVEVDSELDPANETDLYQFTGMAGQSLFVDVVSTSNSGIPYKLVDPYGRVVLATNRMDDQEAMLPISGTYTLLVEGPIANTTTDSYRMNLHRVVETKRPLTFGGTTVDSVSVPGARLGYDFVLTEEEVLYFQPGLNFDSFEWSLSGRSGTHIDNRRGLAISRLPAGEYSIALSGVGDFTGDVSFTTALFSSADVLPTDGTVVSGTLDASHSIAVYQLDGRAGTHFALQPDLNLAFADSNTARLTAMDLSTAFDGEDGHALIDVALRANVFRDGAAVNFILVSDEDRDVLDDNVDFDSIFTGLSAKEALLNVVVDESFTGENSIQAIGVGADGSSYIPDGAGSFVRTSGGTAASANVSIRQDYVDLAWALDGAAWNLNHLRAGGVAAESFTNAFVDVKVSEILEQTALHLTASSPNADLQFVSPANGSYDSVSGGETYDFEIRIGNNGQPIAYDLLFTLGQTTGSIPVYITAPYEYGAIAVDADGDTLSWSLIDGPPGLVIDSMTGVMSWSSDSVVFGQHRVTLRVHDGRGGEDEQSFVLDVSGGEPASILGLVTDSNQQPVPDWRIYLDRNRNGIRDPEEISTTTDDGGQFSFEGIDGGSYVVAQEMQPGWQQVTPTIGSYEVSVDSGEELTGILFLNQQVPLVNSDPVITSEPPLTIVAGEDYVYRPIVEELDGDVLTFDLPLAPAGMALNPHNGTIQWTPRADQIGVESVLLRARDDNGGTDVQYYQITVQAPSTAPVFTSTPPSGPAGAGLPFTYDANAVDADGDSLSYSLSTAPTGATIETATGVISWVPSASQVGTQSFTVTVDDGRGSRADQMFELDVEETSSNVAPRFLSQPPADAYLGSTYFYFVDVLDDNGDPVTLTLESAPAGMMLTTDSILTWQPDPDQLGDQEVQLVADDGRNGVTAQQFTVRVATQPANQPPEITSSPLRSAVAEAPYQFRPVAVDADMDPLLWSLQQGPRGMSIDERTGRIDWLPTTEDLGSQVVTLQVLDTHAAAAELTFDLIVRAVNSPPVILSVPPTEGAIGATYLYQVVAEDADQDLLSFSLGSLPAGMTIDSQTGQIVWTPDAAQEGSHELEVIVSDSAGADTSQKFTVAVAPGQSNRPPSITSMPGLLAAAGQGYAYSTAATDPDGDTVTFALLAAPAGMTIDSLTGQVEWVPASTDIGSTTVTIAASDPFGGTGLQNFVLRVLAANNVPVIAEILPERSFVGSTFRYDVLATDADGDVLSYDLVSGPAEMVIDGLGRVFWKATEVGTHSFTVRVMDRHGAFDVETFDFAVEADTIAPQVVVLVSTNPVNVGTELGIRVHAIDNVAVESLLLTVDGAIVALDENGAGRITMAIAGEFPAVATVRDAAGNSAVDQLDILVIDPSDADGPILEITTPEAAAEVRLPTDVTGTVMDESLVSYQLLLADAETREFREIGAGTQNIENGVLGQVDPTSLSDGSYVLRLEGSDAGGNTSIVERVINVSGAVKLGNFTLSFADMTIPIGGIPIVVGRTYDSLLADQQGDFGYGWRLEFRDVDLRTSVARIGNEEFGFYRPFRDGSRVYLTLPGGQREGFTFKAERTGGFRGRLGMHYPTFIPDPGVRTRLAVPQIELAFSRDGSVITWGTGTLYNPADPVYGGRYYAVTEEGVLLEINGNTGNLEQLVDTNGNTVTYSDDAIISSSGLRVELIRDTKDRIVEVVDPAGNSIRYEYDADGDLVAVVDRAGHVTQLIYDAPRTHYLTEIRDPLGRSGVRSEYDDSGKLIRLLDAAGNATQLLHDPDNFIEQIVDALGNTTTYVYDERGNVLREIDALGGETVRTYDIDNNELTVTDPLGNTTTMEYSEFGDLIAETDPAGNVTRFDYARIQPSIGFGGASFAGFLKPFSVQTERIDPLGNVSRMGYDSRGRLVSMTNPVGETNVFSFNAAGLPLSASRAETTPQTFRYDALGNVTEVVDASGTLTSLTYDANGEILVETRTQKLPDGSTRSLRTERDYDAQGNQILERYYEDNVLLAQTENRYDEVGFLVSSVDALGRVTQYLYDDQGLQVAVIHPDDTPSNDTDNPRTRTEYDPLGRRVARIDEAGNRTQYQYDAVGRLIATLYPDATPSDATDNPRVETVYDLAGRVTATIDERGHRTEFVYDAAGRQVATILPDETPLDASDNPRVRTVYDAAGRVVRQIDPLGNITRFEHDGAGRVTRTTFDDGTTTRNIYDDNGMLEAQVDVNGLRTDFEYDDSGRLTAVVSAEVLNPATGTVERPRTEYEYDNLGNLTAQRNALGRVTRHEYDGRSRRVATELPLGQTSTTTYDAAGNVAAVTDFNGNTTTYTYDARDRIVSRTFADNSAVAMTYTANGLVRSVADARGTTSYSYDERNRLVSQVNPDSTSLTYSYDDAGNRIAVTTPSGTTAYTYDARNRLSSVSDDDGDQTNYFYDALNLVQTQFANGTVESRTYDTLNRLTRVENTAPGGIINSFAYTLDKNGNRLTVEEAEGRRVDYTYDGLSRLTSESIVDPVNGNRLVVYTYDIVGNRLERDDSVDGTTSYEYDDNDRLTAVVSGGATTEYTYDDNGNTLIRRVDGTVTARYAWDFENRLVAVDTDGDGNNDVHYEYDASGVRVSQTAGGEQTRFLVDANRRFAQVLEEYTPGGIIKASYVYGHDLISRKLPGTGGKSFYHVDGLGSTRSLTDPAGLVTGRYIYDAFGQSLAQTGNTGNSLLFAGEIRDSLIGLDYLRARYLNPTTGRFFSRDPFPSDLTRPLTANRYTYVESNPVNFTDPSGLLTLKETTTTLAVFSTLQALAGGGILLSDVVHNREPVTSKLLLASVTLPEFVGNVILIATDDVLPKFGDRLFIGGIMAGIGGSIGGSASLLPSQNAAVVLGTGTAISPSFFFTSRLHAVFAFSGFFSIASGGFDFMGIGGGLGVGTIGFSFANLSGNTVNSNLVGLSGGAYTGVTIVPLVLPCNGAYGGCALVDVGTDVLSLPTLIPLLIIFG